MRNDIVKDENDFVVILEKKCALADKYEVKLK